MKNPEERKKIGIEKYRCPKYEKIYPISGQWSSILSSYASMEIVSCRHDNPNADEDCESEEDIAVMAEGIQFQIMYMNKYFDYDEFNSDPVKEYIDYLYFGFINNIRQA
jgi:hypothetical protein